jgi:hypothetical protein
MQLIRERLENALSGQPITYPVYVVYDLFYHRWDLDWEMLFGLGLGQINHANLLEYDFPHLEIKESRKEKDGKTYRDVTWVTDQGELHEWYIDYWRQEYFVKKPEDYRVLALAFSDVKVKATDKYFEASENELGGRGITLGQLGDMPAKSRSPFQRVQVDFAELEQFSVDAITEQPELMELLEVLTEFKLKEFREAVKTKAPIIKLWENLSIETMGPTLFRKHLASFYEKVFEILEGTGKKIVTHYDGKLKCIAGDIAHLSIDGIDSLTPPPEGDMTIAEARQAWPNKFFWLNPSLSWFSMPLEELKVNIRQMVRDAGPARFCLEISENRPPNWEKTIPAVLEVLNETQG